MSILRLEPLNGILRALILAILSCNKTGSYFGAASNWLISDFSGLVFLPLKSIYIGHNFASLQSYLSKHLPPLAPDKINQN